MGTRMRIFIGKVTNLGAESIIVVGREILAAGKIVTVG
jgi:hypothetical protein